MESKGRETEKHDVTMRDLLQPFSRRSSAGRTPGEIRITLAFQNVSREDDDVGEG